MKYGLIGCPLGHSYSPRVHALLRCPGYELREISADELASFLQKRDFDYINVTIPYKQAVLPFLDDISPSAREIGAVNTIVNRGGRLTGYNTDFSGMTALLRKTGMNPTGKSVLILGTGGTARTAMAVCRAMGAASVRQVSRSGRDGALTYEEALKCPDTRFIINATPCGMYPSQEGCPIDVNAFPALEGVADAIYHPLRTRLVQNAAERGVPACGGLYMLLAQAAEAESLFLGSNPVSPDSAYRTLLTETCNIILIGMPGSGKSTIGPLIAKVLGREFVDTDEEIVHRVGCTIPEYFRSHGENAFRNVESDVVKDISRRVGLVIATGGGSILRRENVLCLRQNGRLYHLDRPLTQLLPTEGRPLAGTSESIARLYEARKPVYAAARDVAVAVDGHPENVAKSILEEFTKCEFFY